MTAWSGGAVDALGEAGHGAIALARSFAVATHAWALAATRDDAESAVARLSREIAEITTQFSAQYAKLSPAERDAFDEVWPRVQATL